MHIGTLLGVKVDTNNHDISGPLLSHWKSCYSACGTDRVACAQWKLVEDPDSVFYRAAGYLVLDLY